MKNGNSIYCACMRFYMSSSLNIIMKPYSFYWAPLALIWHVLPKSKAPHPLFVLLISIQPIIQHPNCAMLSVAGKDNADCIFFCSTMRFTVCSAWPPACGGGGAVGRGWGCGGGCRRRQKGTVALYGIVAGCWWQAHAASRLLQWSGGIWVISSLFTCNYSPLLLLSSPRAMCDPAPC